MERPDARRVLLLGRGSRAYRKRFLELVSEGLWAEGVAFAAVHTDTLLGTQQAGELGDTTPSVPIRAVRWEPLGREVVVSRLPRRWFDADLVVLPEGIGNPTSWSILAARIVARRRTAVFGHGMDFAKPSRDDVAEQLNRWRMRHLDWWFSYNETSTEAAVSRGMPRDRVTAVQNTLPTAGLVDEAERFAATGDTAMRSEIGIGATGPVGLFVGALHESKRPELLMEVLDGIRAQLPDFSMIIVGDGPCAKEVDDWAGTRPWVHRFRGDVTDGRGRYWAVADVATYPAWAGLAINEALATGVPPVVGSGWPHPPEVSYVRDGVNGVVVPGSDPEVYVERVVEVLRDPVRLLALSQGARRCAEELTIDNMSARFCAGVLEALARPPRRVEVRE